MKKSMIVIAVVMMTGLFVFAQTDKPADKPAADKPAVAADKPAAEPAPAIADPNAARELKPQTLCPIEGGKIDKKYFVDINGKRIYMCCPGCAEKIKANPAKYMRLMMDEGIDIEKTPEVKKAPEVKK